MSVGASRPIHIRLKLLKRWGVIWEYLVDESNGSLITIWLKERKAADDVLVRILGGGEGREQIQVLRERPPIVTMSN